MTRRTDRQKLGNAFNDAEKHSNRQTHVLLPEVGKCVGDIDENQHRNIE